MSLLQRLAHKFVRSPLGYGRPLPQVVLDGEYTSGAWKHFHAAPEQPRQILVAGTVARLRPNATLLDLGCGSGRLAELLQPLPFRRYLGVDLSTEGLQRARTLGLTRCEFVQGDFETWRPAEKFDIVLFCECIGYAYDPGEMVASFLPHLAPGGHVIITYFRSSNWQAIWRRIDPHLRPLESTTVANDLGQTWDVRIAQPFVATP